MEMKIFEKVVQKYWNFDTFVKGYCFYFLTFKNWHGKKENEEKRERDRFLINRKGREKERKRERRNQQ